MQVVNPKTVKEVAVEDAKFTVGILPFGKRTELETWAYFNKEAQTEEQLAKLMQQGHEFVKWGIKGHSGLRFEDGSEVPFKMDETLGCVSDETMSVYAATSGLLAKLSTLVTDMNYLKKDVVKN